MDRVLSWRDAMEYSVLGPLEVRDAGGLVPLPAAKQRALLADLLLHAGRVVAVERLVDDLWGEDVPDTAVKALQVHVSRLRRALPGAAIRTRAPGYALELADGDELDLDRFERLVAAGRAALADGRHREAEEMLAEALALWRGPALADVDEPFARAEAARLDEVRAAAVEARVEAGLALGRDASLVAEVEAEVRAHPYRERLRLQLALALHRSGRQAEALSALQAFARLLRDELGLEPSADVRELERRILRHDEALRGRRPEAASDGAAAAGRPLPARPATDGVVGREDELAVLDGALADAADGRRRLVFVTGEPGAGKTTLVETFLARARLPADAAVARGQCIEHRGQGEPYLPILEALGRLCRGERRDEVLGLLRTHAPTWLVQLPALLTPEEHEQLRPLVVGTTRDRMLREMTELLDELTAAAPVVLVLEDLHWSDVSTLDLLEALARRADPARLLLVGTFRPVDAGAAVDEVRRLARDLRIRNLCTEVALGGLGDDAVRLYLDRRLPGAAAPDDVVRLLRDRTRGNPLFMEKLVDAWVESGSLVAEGGAWRPAASVEELAALVPASLRLLIAQRLELVDEPGRRLLEAASLVGARFSAPLLAAAADASLVDVEEACDALAAEDLFLAAAPPEPGPDGTPAAAWVFTHDLCQEVLAERVPPARRALVHGRIAAALERAGGDEPDGLAARIAWHAVHANDRPRAVRNLLRAAHRALERVAVREARGHVALALEIIGDASDEASARLELEAQVLLGAVHLATEGWLSADAEAAYLRARDLALRLDAPDDLALVLFRLASIHEYRGEYERATRLIQETLALSTGPAAAGRAVYSHELLACTLFHQGDHRASVEHADTALSLFDGHVDPLAAAIGESPVVSCNVWAALALWHLGRVDAAWERAERAVAASTLDEARNGRAMAQSQAAVVALCRGEAESARRWAEAAADAAKQLGYPYWGAVAAVAGGWAVARLGDPEEGLARIRSGIAVSRSLGARMDEQFFLGVLADAALAAGRLDEAGSALAESAAAGFERNFFHVPELTRLEACLALARDEPERARRLLGRALADARRLGTPALELRAATTLLRLELGHGGDARPAARALAAVLAGLGEGESTADVREARALLREAGLDAGGTEAAARQPVAYARSGGVHVAYQVSGGGPVDIVLVPGFVSHLELDWEHPAHARFLDRLGGWGRLIRFDKRGTGLSDRAVGIPDLETRMDDVRAVMDAVGSERAVLFGYSEGGPLSLLFAATYPERVSALVLYGAFVKRVDPDEESPWLETREERRLYIDRVCQDWGFEANLRAMCPSADEELARWWGERCRAAASPGAVRALMEMNALVDVRDLLPAIRVPTLVVHRAGDDDVKIEEGRYIARRIPGARLVELPGADHFVAVDPDQILDPVEAFLAEASLEAAAVEGLEHRMLATILVTDVVASTERARALGDRAWADLLERHHTVVRTQLDRFGGQEVDDAGDGFLALFDGPARAIRCGLSIVRGLRDAGLDVRVGVHTGEVERRGRAARGQAVHLAARVAAEAAPGEVAVTETTRDLTEGAGLGFDDRGTRSLKGFDRPRRLFAARLA